MKAEYVGTSEYEIESRHFRYFMNLDKNHGYRTFTIPKKSGGERRIWVPKGNLMWIQYCIKEIIELYYQPQPCVYGFVKGKSILENAQCHTNKKYVFNVDISDFFESVTEKMIATRLLRPPFSFNRQISETIARLSCICIYEWVENPIFHTMDSIHHHVLAQGSPTSPILANAVCDDMDNMLIGLASRFGLTYTRYADDITFSSNHNVYYADSDFRKELVRIIELFGFKINNKKTRLQHQAQKQEVTGLTVNKGANVSRKWYKEIRSILHIWEKYGKYAALNSFYPRYHSNHGLSHHGEADIEHIVYGKLCFLKMVIGENNPRYIKLFYKFQALTSNTSRVSNNEKWQYIYTIPLKAFEKIFHTKIEYRSSQLLTVLYGKGWYAGDETLEEIKSYPLRYFGHFTYNGVSFLVALSGKLQNLQIPDDAEISLCRTRDSFAERYIYLVHRRHCQRKIEQIPVMMGTEGVTTEEISPELLAVAEKMKAMFPELKLEIISK